MTKRQHQSLYDVLHPVGCGRCSWDRNLVPEGVDAVWVQTEPGWWERVE